MAEALEELLVGRKTAAAVVLDAAAGWVILVLREVLVVAGRFAVGNGVPRGPWEEGIRAAAEQRDLGGGLGVAVKVAYLEAVMR